MSNTPIDYESQRRFRFNSSWIWHLLLIPICLLIIAGLAVCPLWVRSYFVYDTISYNPESGNCVDISSDYGAVYIEFTQFDTYPGGFLWEHHTYNPGDLWERNFGWSTSRWIPIKWGYMGKHFGATSRFVVLSDWFLVLLAFSMSVILWKTWRVRIRLSTDGATPKHQE